MKLANAWNDERDVTELTTVPRWIDDDITVVDLAAIVQGGCESGAYMPACTYHIAVTTMNEFGDDVLDYLDDRSARPKIDSDESWHGMAVEFLVAAVDSWAVETLESLDD